VPGTDATRKVPLTAAGLAVLLVLALAAPAGAALARKGTVVGAGADAIPGSYIVTLKPSIGLPGAGTVTTAARRRTATTLAARYGARTGHVYSTVVEGFAAEGLTAAEAAKLAADPAVDRVYEDSVMEPYGEQTGAPWNLDRIDQRDLPLDGGYRYLDNATGHNIHAYVIDSGINAEHEDFGGRATRDYDALGSDGKDCMGHGTLVASALGGTTYGVAKAVRIHSVRVLGCEGGPTGTGADTLAGMDWVAANHQSPAVANFSAGHPSADASDVLYDQAIERLIASGVTTVVSAGNGGEDSIGDDVDGYTPARVPAAITVGATDSSDKRAGFSNFGAGVDLFAPGVDVTTAAIGSTTATTVSNGTSLAAPLVAGAAARYLQRDPNATPSMVANILTSTATSGKVIDAGAGSPNRLLWSEGPPSTNPPPSPSTSTTTTTTTTLPPGPDPRPQGSLTVVSNTSVKGWAEDGSCGGDDPIKVQIEFDPPGAEPRQLRDTIEAGSPVENHANHGFTYTHSFPVGSKVYVTALGIGSSCGPDGTKAELQGSGWEVPAPWSAGDPPPAEGATSFVPVAQWPGMTTGVQVLNSDTVEAKATVHRIWQDGTPAAPPEDITVPAGAAKTLLDRGTGEAASMLIEGKDGAARLSTVNDHILGGRASASNGFSRGTRQVHLPLLLRHHDDTMTTWFAVQNTTREQAVIDITYSYMVPNPAGNASVRAMERDLVIPPLATKVVKQEDAPGPPSGTLFSAEVSASKGLIAVTVFEESAENLLEYSGIPEEQAATQVAVPLVMANNFGAWTGVQIMNVGDQAATIGITYGTNSADKADPAMPKGRCTDPNGKYKEGVLPGESANFLQRTGTKEEETSVFRDCTFVGSALIFSDQPVVAIINQVSPYGQSAYEGRPTSRLTTTVRLPLVQVNNFGITGAVQIANQSLETVPATVTFGPNIADEPKPGSR
jgi:hypothetical protein